MTENVFYLPLFLRERLFAFFVFSLLGDLRRPERSTVVLSSEVVQPFEYVSTIPKLNGIQTLVLSSKKRIPVDFGRVMRQCVENSPPAARRYWRDVAQACGGRKKGLSPTRHVLPPKGNVRQSKR